MEPSVTSRQFGRLRGGATVTQYTLGAAGGMAVDLIDYGARVRAIRMPDRDGRVDDIALGYSDLAAYEADRSNYFGATIGRCANRIANGRFRLDGRDYVIPTRGAHALHGGSVGFDRRLWDARCAHSPGEGAWVEFAYESPDGEMGFPGALRVSVRYELSAAGQLRISYRAMSDRATVVNLTNHTYFNLAGSGDVLDHRMGIAAGHFTPVDEELIPTGDVTPVEGTPMDLRRPVPLRERLGAGCAASGGYDLNWVLDSGGNMETAAATLDHPVSGRRLSLYTTEPGLQFYTGEGLRAPTPGGYGLRAGVALEAQHFPDAVHHPHFPSVRLEAGDVYRQETVYAFSVLRR